MLPCINHTASHRERRAGVSGAVCMSERWFLFRSAFHLLNACGDSVPTLAVFGHTLTHLGLHSFLGYNSKQDTALYLKQIKFKRHKY